MGPIALLDSKNSKHQQRLFWILCLALISVLAIILSIFQGTLSFSIPAVLSVLSGSCQDRLTQHIIFNVRLPRVLIGALVGLNMGVAGALLQGLLRNPLASPNVIGANSGAGLAAVIIMCLLPGKIQLLPPAAFLGALLAGLIIYALSRREGSSSTTTIILAGIALGALFCPYLRHYDPA